MLVRSWNLFHGNTVPPQRRGFLREMVERASADDPDVLCLQEIPAWALEQLSEWSGMQTLGALATRPMLGPLPSTAALGHALSRLHAGLLRSEFSGQANALLVSQRLRARVHETITLNPRRFRRAQARWLGLGLVARLAWAAERRVCQVARLTREDGHTLLVTNLHATSYAPDRRLADAELLRAATFADGLARPDEPLVFAGDFNITRHRSRTLRELTTAEWGFSQPGEGIDHILVRGLHAQRGRHWPDDRRRLDGRLLSDHAPLEVQIE